MSLPSDTQMRRRPRENRFHQLLGMPPTPASLLPPHSPLFSRAIWPPCCSLNTPTHAHLLYSPALLPPSGTPSPLPHRLFHFLHAFTPKPPSRGAPSDTLSERTPLHRHFLSSTSPRRVSWWHPTSSSLRPKSVLSYTAERRCRCDEVNDVEMRRLSWTVWAGPVSPQGPYERRASGLVRDGAMRIDEEGRGRGRSGGATRPALKLEGWRHQKRRCP